MPCGGMPCGGIGPPRPTGGTEPARMGCCGPGGGAAPGSRRDTGVRPLGAPGGTWEPEGPGAGGFFSAALMISSLREGFSTSQGIKGVAHTQAGSKQRKERPIRHNPHCLPRASAKPLSPPESFQ